MLPAVLSSPDRELSLQPKYPLINFDPVALSIGPLSIIATLMGMHFLIAIILSAIVYNEKLKAKTVLGILLAIVAVVFLRL